MGDPTVRLDGIKETPQTVQPVARPQVTDEIERIAKPLRDTFASLAAKLPPGAKAEMDQFNRTLASIQGAVKQGRAVDPQEMQSLYQQAAKLMELLRGPAQHPHPLQPPTTRPGQEKRSPAPVQKRVDTGAAQPLTNSEITKMRALISAGDKASPQQLQQITTRLTSLAGPDRPKNLDTTRELLLGIARHPNANPITLRMIIREGGEPGTAAATALKPKVSAQIEHWKQVVRDHKNADPALLREIASILCPDARWNTTKYRQVLLELVQNPCLALSDLESIASGLYHSQTVRDAAQAALARRQQPQAVPVAPAPVRSETATEMEVRQAELHVLYYELARNPRATAEQLAKVKATAAQLDEIMWDSLGRLRKAADASSVAAIQDIMTAVIRHPNYELNTGYLKSLRQEIDAPMEWKWKGMIVEVEIDGSVRDAARSVLETLAASRLAQLQQIVRDPNADSLQLGDITFALEPEPNREGLRPFQDVWREAMFHPNMSGILLAARLSTEAPAYQTTRAALDRRMAHLLELARNPDTTAVQLEDILSETRSINDKSYATIVKNGT